MSLALDGTSPRSRRTDPVTSVDAGRWADWGTSQGQVIRFLEGRRHRFWTLKTFVPAVQAWAESIGDDVFSESRYRSAVKELTDQGLITLTGDTDDAPRGHRSRIWTLTERAK
jgi:hypothetical protein